MQSFPPTVVIRHKRENLKKCSLRGLEGRGDFVFISYPYTSLPPLDTYIVLIIGAPPLTKEDMNHGLLVIDATWRHANTMVKPFLNQSQYLYRSLPHHFKTSYPRRQDDCEDPTRGLASVEAIYLAYSILERDKSGLLDQYYWKDPFLKLNKMQ